jgi:hypothetical protein
MILRGIANFDQELNSVLCTIRGRTRDEPIPKGIGEHLQGLMASGERPTASHFNQSKRLPESVEVHTGGSTDVLNQDDRPVAQWYVFQGTKAVDRCGDLPSRAEVPRDLLL